MAKHAVEFKRIVEFESKGKRWRKVTGAESKQFKEAVRDTYESSPGVPTFGFFVPVDAKPIEPEPAKAD